MTGAYYQSFAGVAPDKIDVVVHFIDGDTKEVLSTTSYRDYVNEMESSGDANHSGTKAAVFKKDGVNPFMAGVHG